MNKTKSFHSRESLIASMLVFILAGCGSTFKATPTTLPPYLHYTPSEGFDVHLEFDYPSSWLLEENTNTTYSNLFMGEQRWLAVPTQTPGVSHMDPNDYGYISIMFQPAKPGQTPDTELESHKQSYIDTHWMTVLNDYKIKIDEHDASVLEYLTNDLESSPSLMFNRRIFFTVNDQFYEIFYSVAEKDRGGEFEKGYEYFFNSLKVVP